MPSTNVTGPSQMERKRSPVWAMAAPLTMPEGFVRLMWRASGAWLAMCPGVHQGGHGAQGVGEAAGAHRLLAGQPEGVRERLVEATGGEAPDADLDEDDVGTVEGPRGIGLGAHRDGRAVRGAALPAGLGDEGELVGRAALQDELERRATLRTPGPGGERVDELGRGGPRAPQDDEAQGGPGHQPPPLP
jgi:hypothetical protein